jgi:hypothetical protein
VAGQTHRDRITVWHGFDQVAALSRANRHVRDAVKSRDARLVHDLQHDAPLCRDHLDFVGIEQAGVVDGFAFGIDQGRRQRAGIVAKSG